jgi:hypothetical protein
MTKNSIAICSDRNRSTWNTQNSLGKLRISIFGGPGIGYSVVYRAIIQIDMSDFAPEDILRVSWKKENESNFAADAIVQFCVFIRSYRLIRVDRGR